MNTPKHSSRTIRGPSARFRGRVVNRPTSATTSTAFKPLVRPPELADMPSEPSQGDDVVRDDVTPMKVVPTTTDTAESSQKEENKRKDEKGKNPKKRVDKWGVFAVGLFIELRTNPEMLSRFDNAAQKNHVHDLRKLWDILVMQYNKEIHDRGGEEFASAEYSRQDLQVCCEYCIFQKKYHLTFYFYYKLE